MVIRDGGWTLLEHDEALGRTVWSMFDGERTHIRTDYRCDQIVRQNRNERNKTGNGWGGDWHKIGAIPLNVYHDSGMSEAIGQKDSRFIAKWLTENDAFRTKDGRL